MTCTKCGLTKLITEFAWRAGKAGRRTQCKECDKAAVYLWRSENPEKAKATRTRTALREYGLTVEQRDSMVIAQDGLCAICRQERPLCVDHDHTTDEVRGLLCNQCNLAIGLLGEDVETLIRAADYLGRVVQ